MSRSGVRFPASASFAQGQKFLTLAEPRIEEARPWKRAHREQEGIARQEEREHQGLSLRRYGEQSDVYSSADPVQCVRQQRRRFHETVDQGCQSHNATPSPTSILRSALCHSLRTSLVFTANAAGPQPQGLEVTDHHQTCERATEDTDDERDEERVS
jgi:hypothetical protein